MKRTDPRAVCDAVCTHRRGWSDHPPARLDVMRGGIGNGASAQTSHHHHLECPVCHYTERLTPAQLMAVLRACQKKGLKEVPLLGIDLILRHTGMRG